MLSTQNMNPALQKALLIDEVRRIELNQGVIESESRKLLKTLRDNPLSILNNKANFIRACETFLWIQDKHRDIRRFKLNRSQKVLVDAYFEMKEITPAVRINILKGRQQGMSTVIAACAVIEMLARQNTRALIISEEKGGSGENIFGMYQMYFKYFQDLLIDELSEVEKRNWFWEEDIQKRFQYGHQFHLPNGSGFNVVGEKLVTSRTLQFIHLSEAAFFNHLKDCLGMLNQTIPKTSDSAMFIETTAKEYGNDHYDEWMGACAGRSAFKPLFVPWYIHEEYRKPFPSDEAKLQFIAEVGTSEEDEFGNEKALLDVNLEQADWIKHWHTIDFEGYDKITYENLNWRRLVIRELNGVIPEFNRQYPTTPEMAFLSNSAHVLDMNAVRWYLNYENPDTLEKMIKDPARGQLVEKIDGSNVAAYKEMRGGILHTWEDPDINKQYVIGVDVAEGKDGGDWSCAYVCSRMPFRIVAKIRGYDGRRVTLDEFTRQLYLVGKYYNNAAICPENNNQGSGLVMMLSQWSYPNMVSESIITHQPSDRFGWMNVTGMREVAIALLQEAIHSKSVGIPDNMIIDEAHHFVYVNGKAQAARKGQNSGAGITLPGSTDDCLFALIGAILANKALPRAKTTEEMQFERFMENQKRTERGNRDSHGADWMLLI